MIREPSANECPIWRTPARTSYIPQMKSYISNSERTGGEYQITDSAIRDLLQRDDKRKSILTTWIIEQRRIGVLCPSITVDILDKISIEQAMPVHKRAERFLTFCGERSTSLGERVHFYVYLDLLAWTESISDQEVQFLAEYVERKGWITFHTGASSGARSVCVVTADGYAFIDELSNRRIESSQGFVAMWFDKSLDDIYETGIEQGIRLAGYTSQRLDRSEYNDKIDDQIIAEIRRSRFVVADFTSGDDGARGSVYFESGFANGLKIPVIYTCRKDCLTKVHFDVRQYNFIDWTSAETLRKRLADRISATIGDGTGPKR